MEVKALKPGAEIFTSRRRAWLEGMQGVEQWSELPDPPKNWDPESREKNV